MKKLLFDIAKVITAVATIGGGALWFDAKFDKQNETLNDIKLEVEYVSADQALMSEDIANIQDTLHKFGEEHLRQGDNIRALGWAIRNKENFTPEQLEELLNREFQRNRVYNRASELEFIPIE